MSQVGVALFKIFIIILTLISLPLLYRAEERTFLRLMASTLCALRTLRLLSLDPHVMVEAVEELPDAVVSDESVRCRGLSSAGGGGVAGGDMLERLELTAESVSLSSSAEW